MRFSLHGCILVEQRRSRVVGEQRFFFQASSYGGPSFQKRAHCHSVRHSMREKRTDGYAATLEVVHLEHGHVESWTRFGQVELMLTRDVGPTGVQVDGVFEEIREAEGVEFSD